MKKIYLPDDPLSNLGRAMFYVAYAWAMKWYQDHGMQFGTYRHQQLVYTFERVIMLWSFALVPEEGDPAFVQA